MVEWDRRMGLEGLDRDKVLEGFSPAILLTWQTSLSLACL